jgi:hypothetical protein
LLKTRIVNQADCDEPGDVAATNKSVRIFLTLGINKGGKDFNVVVGSCMMIVINCFCLDSESPDKGSNTADGSEQELSCACQGKLGRSGCNK